MKSMVAISETNDSVDKFDYYALPPPLLPSLEDDGSVRDDMAIEHISLYL